METADERDWDIFAAVIDRCALKDADSVAVLQEASVGHVEQMERFGVRDSLRDRGLAAETLRSLVDRNQDGVVLPPVPQGVKAVLVERRVIDEIVRDGGWLKRGDRLADCSELFAFSLPGYSPDGKQAAVFRDFGWPGITGGSTLVALKRSDGGWSISHELVWAFS
jgi:hypothetical protein